MSSLRPAALPSEADRRITNSRPTSATDYVQGGASNPTKAPPSSTSPRRSKEVHYTCFIRLPFKRDGFEDPPPAEWDSTKDKALWKLVSKASSSTDMNWEEVAHRFDVSLPFLLQQAAWLYERHFESMKAQMRKLSSHTGDAMSPKALADSPTKSAVAAAGAPMQRAGSRGMFTKVSCPSTGELSS